MMDEFNKFRFREFFVPEYMRPALIDYVNDGVPPGDFLKAIICNDLKEAVGRADDINVCNIPAYVNYFYNHAPHSCWGSKSAMDSWVGKKLQERG
jgi:hypothetical protein